MRWLRRIETGSRSGRLLIVVAFGLLAQVRGDSAVLDPPWIEIDAPSEGEVLRSPIGLIELRGRVGQGDRGVYDVVVAVDVSQSSFLPTGIDLDGDGTLGKLRSPVRGRSVSRGDHRRWTTDADDTVIQGEIAVARRLIENLHPTRARVSLLSYSGDARIVAPLGAPADARAALDRWTPRPSLTGTSLAAAVSRSLREFSAAAENDRERAVEAAEARGEDPDAVSLEPRRRAILLLASDGLATASQRRYGGLAGRSERREKQLAASEAIAVAGEARASDVLVYAFEIENGEDEDPGLLATMSETAGGRYVYVENPQRLAFELPNPGSFKLAGITIENTTTGEAARATRLFANGEFDGFVRLVEGLNQIEVRATLPGGRELQLRRSVRFVKPAQSYVSDTARIEKLRDLLRQRTAETRLLPPTAPPDQKLPRPPRKRDVTIEVPEVLPPTP